MRQFHDTDMGVGEMSARELNEIAVHRAGIVGSIGYGFAARELNLPEERHGYGFRWIATGGMGNCGTLVLVGRSRVAREMLRHGRIARYAHELGISAYDAARLDRAAAGLGGWAREIPVLSAAIATAADNAWDIYPGAGRGGGSWRTDYAPHLSPWLGELSCPRLDAVHAIVRRLRGEVAQRLEMK